MLTQAPSQHQHRMQTLLKTLSPPFELGEVRRRANHCDCIPALVYTPSINVKPHHADHSALLVMQAHSKRVKAEFEEASALDESREVVRARREALRLFFLFVRLRISPLSARCKINAWLLKLLGQMEDDYKERVDTRMHIKREPEDVSGD